MEVKLHDGILTISGKKQEEVKEENDKYNWEERSFGTFSRSMRVPEGTTQADIKVKLANGVLEVTFPNKKDKHPRQPADPHPELKLHPLSSAALAYSCTFPGLRACKEH